MVFFVAFALLLVYVSELSAQKGDKGDCYSYSGSPNYLRYDLQNINITERATYRLTFRTTEENGLLLYAKGSHDFEALFIRNGKLHYFLFNPTSYGSGESYGGQFESSDRVNNGTWITVEAFRNKIPKRRFNRIPTTGMIITSEDGEKEKHSEPGKRSGVHIVPTVYIGGVEEDLGQGSEGFIGTIKDVREKSTGTVFKGPTYNNQERADRCVGVDISSV